MKPAKYLYGSASRIVGFKKFFIKILVKEHCGKDLAIAFDPSYISKSGKKTPGAGYFWSGRAGKAKWGLEISGLAAIDPENHTAFHLEAVQTIDVEENETLLGYYLNIILERKKGCKGSQKSFWQMPVFQNIIL